MESDHVENFLCVRISYFAMSYYYVNIVPVTIFIENIDQKKKIYHVDYAVWCTCFLHQLTQN
jgi:hypothetical protein